MSKLGRNLLITFTIICMFAVVVFTIELLVINRDNDGNTDPNPYASGDASPGQGGSSGNGQQGGANASGGQGSSSESDQSGDAQPEFVTRTYTIPISNGNNIVMSIEEDPENPYFEYKDMGAESEDIICVLRYRGNAAASLEFRYIQLTQGAGAFASMLLEEEFGIEDSTIIGSGPIKESELDGFAVSGELDGVTYEAWVHSFADIGNNNAGIAIIMSYPSGPAGNTPRELINLILNTMDITSDAV